MFLFIEKTDLTLTKGSKLRDKILYIRLKNGHGTIFKKVPNSNIYIFTY